VHGICDEVAQKGSDSGWQQKIAGWKSKDVVETDSLTSKCEGSARTVQETRVVSWEGELGNAVSGRDGCLLQKSTDHARMLESLKGADT